jgi:CelD/BcsL family acetyltransferase involved in cellulose biosynthesis
MTAAFRTRPRPHSTALARTAVHTLSLDGLSALAPAWNRLVDRAAYANPFYSQAVMAAHAAQGIGGAPAFCVVQRGPELLAVLPVVRRRIGFWRAAAVGWSTPFTTNGTPLVDGEALEAAVEALLDGLAAQSRLVMLPLVGLDHPVMAAVRRAAQARDWPCCVIASFDRPVLDRRESFDAYATGHLSTSRRKGLRRRRSKLAEVGEVTFRSATGGAALAEAVDEFLALERAGWKGSRGTALASRPATIELARALFARADGPVTARADMIRLDGRPIAVSLALVCDGTAHLLKTAFDESLRAYAPGIVLEAEIVRACHEDRFADRLDSASLPGGVLDDLYADRERIGDLLFATTAEVGASALQRVADAERLRRAAMKQLKQLYSRMAGGR